MGSSNGLDYRSVHATDSQIERGGNFAESDHSTPGIIDVAEAAALIVPAAVMTIGVILAWSAPAYSPTIVGCGALGLMLSLPTIAVMQALREILRKIK